MTSCRSIALACALALPLSSALAQSASVTTAAAKMPGVRVQAGEIEVRAKVVELDSARRIRLGQTRAFSDGIDHVVLVHPSNLRWFVAATARMAARSGSASASCGR